MVCRVAGGCWLFWLSGALLGITTRPNLDFGLRQRVNPHEIQAITTKGGLAAGSFDSRQGRKFLWASGAVPPGNMPELYRDHHALLLPSFSEGFPIVPLEAMANGCVPICSRLEHVTDHMIVDGESGCLVDVLDHDGFVNAIGALHGDSAKWQAMSVAARRRTEKHFSLQAMGDSYMTLIREACAGRYPLEGGRPGIDWRVLGPKCVLPRWMDEPIRRARNALTGKA